ncbi:MAG: Radical domain protein [Herbinix sp.]|jgi:putative DNA modification/repair radical SAM protein|nr:Radical domain protein [Herbinix sp.]
MVYIGHENKLSIENKILLMREDARFDVADANLTYGPEESEEVSIPDPSLFQDIHSKQAPPKVPKVFLSNKCIFNCAYCSCRASRESDSRYCNTPRELAEISVQQAKDNGHGVFITSAIYQNANYTEELIIETLRIMREELFYKGYIHAKVMPGTDPLLIEKAGRYANRLSVNIEVAQNSGYERIAKQKNKQIILTPMHQICNLVQYAKQFKGKSNPYLAMSQTTQLMAGSTEETDRTIMTLSEALYKKFHLSRVYYTNFQYVHEARGYELPITQTPSWRARRLYQADRLQQLYGFTPDEITPEQAPNLTEHLDPKIGWALRNIHLFPIEVNRADYEELLRIPGIGLTYAKKILRARQFGTITHRSLRAIGVSLKRSNYFITCDGKYEGGKYIEHPELLEQIFQE